MPLSCGSGSPLPQGTVACTKEQYEEHIRYLKELEKQYKNLKVCFVKETAGNTRLYVKENTGVIMAKTDSPETVFVICERNMVSAFWDYLEKRVLM